MPPLETAHDEESAVRTVFVPKQQQDPTFAVCTTQPPLLSLPTASYESSNTVKKRGSFSYAPRNIMNNSNVGAPRSASMGGKGITRKKRMLLSSASGFANLQYCVPVESSSTSSPSPSPSSTSNDFNCMASPRISLGYDSIAVEKSRLLSRRAGEVFLDKLLKVSNVASLLCVLDCTILPVLTVLLPLMGMMAGPQQLKWLHEAGHSMALYFVLPVAGLATTMNYLRSHGKLWITAIGWLGMLLVFVANHHGFGHHHHHLQQSMPEHRLAWLMVDLIRVLHSLHHGMVHRVTNLMGCSLLLTSNYLSHKHGNSSSSDKGTGGGLPLTSSRAPTTNCTFAWCRGC